MIPQRIRELFWDARYYLRPVFYLGFGVQCPLCGWRWRRFVPHGKPERENARCAHCDALERHRLMFLFLKKHTALFETPLRLLHFAPEKTFYTVFSKARNISYCTVDLCVSGVDAHMDITRLAFPDGTFDAVLCSHVLEHIPDDAAAIREIRRVLRPGGWALLHVPLHPTLLETYEDPTIVDPVERRKHFGQEDHVRYYGRDFGGRIEREGFQVKVISFAKTLDADTIRNYGIPFDEDIYFCNKPA
jgi:predicted SAM-dependent methyltransferase